MGSAPSVTIRSDGPPAAPPVHPVRSWRELLPCGTEAGAETSICVPTGCFTSHGVAHAEPLTITLTPARVLFTIRWPTGVYVATRRTPTPTADAGTVSDCEA